MCDSSMCDSQAKRNAAVSHPLKLLPKLLSGLWYCVASSFLNPHHKSSCIVQNNHQSHKKNNPEKAHRLFSQKSWLKFYAHLLFLSQKCPFFAKTFHWRGFCDSEDHHLPIKEKLISQDVSCSSSSSGSIGKSNAADVNRTPAGLNIYLSGKS